MIALLGSVLAASVLGSAHCAGMCGGFVCFFSGQNGTRPRAHVAYHFGRLTSYATLGAIAGAIGASLDHFGAVAGLARVSAWVAGALMLAWGIASIAGTRGIHFPVRAPRALRVPIAAIMRRVAPWPSEARALTLGLVTTLLPCGWLYAFVATAAGTGSALGGAAVMASFWLGTVPVLAGLGALAQGAWAPLRQRLPIVSGCLLIALGLLTISGKFRHSMAGMHSGAPACHEMPAAKVAERVGR